MKKNKKDENENHFYGYRVTKDNRAIWKEGYENVLESLSDNHGELPSELFKICEAYLEEIGYRYDEEKEMWFDEEKNEFVEASENVDSVTFSYNENYMVDVIDWAFEKGMIEYRVYDSGHEGWFFVSDKISSFNQNK